MKLVRSFPDPILAGRNYIVDDAQHVTVNGYDYVGLAGVNDDVIQLDWDTAVSRGDLTNFAEQARREPGRVHVAPVPIYPDNAPGIPGPFVWNCRVYVGEEPQRYTRYVSEGEPKCNLFGFGMVYLPRHMVTSFIATGWHFDDTTFASWHDLNYGPTPIAWDVRPVHTHYRISEVIK